MVHRPNIDPNLAFVLMPFKPPFDSYYDEIIRPAAKSVGLEVRKADEVYGTGPIINDIWKQIWAATVVIADVTAYPYPFPIVPMGTHDKHDAVGHLSRDGRVHVFNSAIVEQLVRAGLRARV
ncbi:MAG: hypothetical protein LAN61_04875 [Acidobacteriia bacterium]|nr:hypothetical protein [Terriglobia bacterium]